LYAANFGFDSPLKINQELCAEVKLKPQTLRLVNAAINGFSSIDDSRARTALRNLPYEINHFLEVEDAQLSDVLDSVLWSLTEREDGVLRMRFGIGYNSPQTLDEIGEVFGVTRERIRQLQNSALTKMRRALRKKEKPMPKPATGLA
jgi:RNA polymerase primary sigma factor